jgi:hypothetical protein
MNDVSRIFVPIFGAFVLAGCAHTNEQRVEAATTTTVAAPEEREIIAIVDPAAPEDVPRARPRLSQTVTLGQGSADAQYTGPAAPPPPRAEGGNQPTVVINNTIVQQPPPVYGYGYGYGAWGYRGAGYGAGTMRPDAFGTPGGQSRPAWGTNGWEGARRTAAPGQTPGVGGTWAPAPSFGPAPMR